MSSDAIQDDRRALAAMQGLTILCVEDDAEVRNQLATFLGRRFARVLTASDGGDGIKQYQAADPKPDLVITDIRMPIMDGLAMTRLLHELDPDLPVMVTTAHEETDYLLEAINLDVERFFTKPVDTDQLHRYLLRRAAQIETDQALAEARQQLADNEARYRAVFWTAMDAFCLFDWEERRIVEINRQFQALYLWSAQQIEGEPLERLFTKADATRLDELLDTAVSADEPLILTQVDRDGTRAPVEVMFGRFEVAGRTLGLQVSRDARPLIENMDEQDALVDTLEATVEAMENLIDDSQQSGR